MSSKNLVICDPETEYASRLASFLSGKKELALQVKIYKSLNQVQAVPEDMPIHVLIVSGEYPYEQRRTVNAGKVIVLSADRQDNLGENEISVYKYQSGNEIYKQMLQACAGDGGDEFLRTGKKEKGKIIGIYSPVHRTGQTTFAINKGNEMSRDHNVLYLNLETYAGFGGHFPEERSRNLSALLYYAKQETGNLGIVLSTVVKSLGNLYYVPPVLYPDDIRSVTEREWICLFHEILRTSIYDILILDLSECIQGLYEILKICDTIYLPEADDRFAASKLAQFQECLHQTGYGELWERVVHCDIRRTAARTDSWQTGHDPGSGR